MKIATRILVTYLLLLPFTSIAQTPDTLIKKLDTLSIKADSAGGQINNINEIAYNEHTKINVPGYFILLGSDLKQEITAPFHWHRKSWIKAGAIVLTTACLAISDEHVQEFAVRLSENSGAVRDISRFITRFGGTYELCTLGSLAAYGFITKNQKLKTTTLVATQSLLTAGVMEYIFKFLTGRQRPSYSDHLNQEPEPTFHGPFGNATTAPSSRSFSSAFPSGHTAEAFAAATVFAMEYRDKPLVPIIAYTAASLVGLSRVTENRHWITDVFAGAVLGFFTGRLAVNNYHRYARIKSEKQKKNSLSFKMHYNQNHFSPGLVYHFR